MKNRLLQLVLGSSMVLGEKLTCLVAIRRVYFYPLSATMSKAKHLATQRYTRWSLVLKNRWRGIVTSENCFNRLCSSNAAIVVTFLFNS